MCDRTPSNAWHDSFICVIWRIHWQVPLELASYFRDCAHGTSDIDIMGFLTLLYYITISQVFLIHMCDMTDRGEREICGNRIAALWDASVSLISHVIPHSPLLVMSHIPRAHMRQATLTFWDLWLSSTTLPTPRYASFIRVSWLIHTWPHDYKCNMTCSYVGTWQHVWHDTFTYGTWLSYTLLIFLYYITLPNSRLTHMCRHDLMCAMTHISVGHNFF